MKKKNLLINLLCIIFLSLLITIPLKAQESVYLGAVLGVKDDVSGNTAKEHKVIVGNVGKITGNKIVLEDSITSSTTEADIDTTAKIVGQDKKLLKLNQIKLKDKIAVISSDSSTLRVYVKPASDVLASKRRAVQGIITAIKGSTLTVTHQIHPERVFIISVSKLTLITKKGSVNATVDDLEVGQRVVAMGDIGINDSISAKLIHVIPGKAVGIMNEQITSTPSAVLSITPTATSTPSAETSPSATTSSNLE